MDFQTQYGIPRTPTFRSNILFRQLHCNPFLPTVAKFGPCTGLVSKIDIICGTVPTEIKMGVLKFNFGIKMKQAWQEAFLLHGRESIERPTASIK